MYTCILVTVTVCIPAYVHIVTLDCHQAYPFNHVYLCLRDEFVWICRCIYMQVCHKMYIYVYTSTYIHICMYTYMYMHTQTSFVVGGGGQARTFLFILFVVWERVCGLFIGLFQYMDLHTFIYMYTHPYMYLHPCIQMYADMHVWFIVFVVREREWVVYWYLSSTYVYTYMRIYTYKYLHPHTSTYMLICIYDYSVCCVWEREWVGYWYCFCNHYTMHQVSIHLALAVW
jgi:hypothetical protein